MNKIIRSTRFWLLGAVATVALAGTAYATIPAEDGVIHGCYAKSGGTLRVIDASVTTCKSGETALSWSQHGVPGPTGDPGEQGEPGAPGGLAGYVRTFTQSDETSVNSKTQTVPCPSGKVPVGGGARVDRVTGSFISVPEVALDRSEPIDTGWAATAHEVIPTDLPWNLLTFVICADAA
jgi:hypothetical protein